MEPAADLRERNLGTVFDAILDHDGDGVITAGDFAQLAAGVCEQLGIPDGPRAVAVRAGYQSWWGQLSATCDRDGDGRITRAEFTTAHLAGQGDPDAYYRQQFGSLAAILAGAMDADGDGLIEQAEYVRLFRVAQVSDQVVLAGFARLDQDGDGRISTQEFQAGAAHVFLSQDPADPGTGMLGLA